MSKFDSNYWNTQDLVLNIMQRCATHCGVDIHDDSVADKLYNICSDLEDWPEDDGFGSSDAYTYLADSKEEFNLQPGSKAIWQSGVGPIYVDIVAKGDMRGCFLVREQMTDKACHEVHRDFLRKQG